MHTATEMSKTRRQERESGFTLVELSIVLVIIGLIIGGVLVGQDLIRAAEIRAQITQIEQYNAAVNTFRNRFNGMPGDIRSATDFFPTAEWPNMRNGNGNRQLEWASAGVTSGLANVDGTATYTTVDTAAPQHVGEVLQFWHHLSAAELINGSFNGQGGDGSAEEGTIVFSFPATRLDRNGIGVFASQGRNYYQLGVISGASYSVEASLTPEEAFNIDSKVDDGRPASGSVVVRSSYAASGSPLVDSDLVTQDVNFAGGTNTSACILENVTLTDPSSVRSASYATGNNAIACTLRLRMN